MAKTRRSPRPIRGLATSAVVTVTWERNASSAATRTTTPTQGSPGRDLPMGRHGKLATSASCHTTSPSLVKNLENHPDINTDPSVPWCKSAKGKLWCAVLKNPFLNTLPSREYLISDTKISTYPPSSARSPRPPSSRSAQNPSPLPPAHSSSSSMRSEQDHAWAEYFQSQQTGLHSSTSLMPPYPYPSNTFSDRSLHRYGGDLEAYSSPALSVSPVPVMVQGQGEEDVEGSSLHDVHKEWGSEDHEDDDPAMMTSSLPVPQKSALLSCGSSDRRSQDKRVSFSIPPTDISNEATRTPIRDSLVNPAPPVLARSMAPSVPHPLVLPILPPLPMQETSQSETSHQSPFTDRYEAYRTLNPTLAAYMEKAQSPMQKTQDPMKEVKIDPIPLVPCFKCGQSSHSPASCTLPIPAVDTSSSPPVSSAGTETKEGEMTIRNSLLSILSACDALHSLMKIMRKQAHLSNTPR